VIDTFEALAVVGLAILPGASYTFTFERVAGSFGQNLADRVIRFIVASAVLQALFSGPTYLLYQKYVLSGQAGRGQLEWYWVWIASAAYVLLPAGLGLLVGWGRVHRKRWALRLTGPDLEPRAWDQMWNRPVTALVRIKLKSGRWIGGIFERTAAGKKAYAGGYPHDGDLYLTRLLEVNPETGEYVKQKDETHTVVDRGLLIRWAEVEYLDIEEY
jgi:uncharacterized protein DUF6338